MFVCLFVCLFVCEISVPLAAYAANNKQLTDHTDKKPLKPPDTDSNFLFYNESSTHRINLLSFVHGLSLIFSFKAK